MIKTSLSIQRQRDFVNPMIVITSKTYIKYNIDGETLAAFINLDLACMSTLNCSCLTQVSTDYATHSGLN